jgi:hypothetical protein
MPRVLYFLPFLLLAACQTATTEALQPLEFHGSVYRVNTASIDMADDYHTSGTPPHIEKMCDVTPADAIKRWSDARLVAAGQTGRMDVDIQDASIVRHDVPKTSSGVTGAFTTEQTEIYEGTLEVELKLYDTVRPLPFAHLHVSAHQSQTLPDNAAPIDREHLCHNMTVEMMRRLDSQLDANIRTYFSNYLL